MLKPLTMSLSLAVALGFSSLSMAGGICASSQCPSPQAAPSAQCAPSACAPKKCNLFSGMGNLCGQLKSLCTPKPKCYTYTWVLKKKRVWGCHSGTCGAPTCDTCGVYPSGQAAPSGQAMPAAQAYGAGQATASLIPTPAPTI